MPSSPRSQDPRAATTARTSARSSDFDLATVDRLLSTTRAVRRRLDLERPVPPAIIHDCIRLSQQAPTASNSQGWR